MPRSPNHDEPRSHKGRGSRGVGVTRRAVLSGAAMLGVGAGIDHVLSGSQGAGGSRVGSAETLAGAVPFYGIHQAGIATSPQGYLYFATFDVLGRSARALADLLQRWSVAAAAMTAGREYAPTSDRPVAAPADTGEALDLAPAQLTITFGFGPSLFGTGPRGRFGLAARKPDLLEVLPAFPGEQLDPLRSNGDLCVQACANDPQVAFRAIHVLSRIAAQDAILRWTQLGFRKPSTGDANASTPRNLLGFKDGTNNVRGDDQAAMSRFVWVQRGDRPDWMTGGTYLVTRRIQIVFPGWDVLSIQEQERAIGRYKVSGSPLGSRREHDPVDLRATTSGGAPVIPIDAHVRVAAPATNGGRRILRRGYSYSGGMTTGPLDRGGHQIDGGLFFIACVRDPRRQFIPLMQRVATRDALAAFTLHIGSGLFACPPGARAGGFVGEGLFA
jgi:deferrochelatase/peroxidase EfeB